MDKQWNGQAVEWTSSGMENSGIEKQGSRKMACSQAAEWNKRNKKGTQEKEKKG